MSPVFLARTILLLLLAEYLLESLVDWLNQRRAARGLPRELQDTINEDGVPEGAGLPAGGCATGPPPGHVEPDGPAGLLES
jgi:hypothetical protein